QCRLKHIDPVHKNGAITSPAHSRSEPESTPGPQRRSEKRSQHRTQQRHETARKNIACARGLGLVCWIGQVLIPPSDRESLYLNARAFQRMNFPANECVADFW